MPPSPETAPATDLPSVLERVAKVEGWMSPGQAEMLWNAASAVRPGGQIVEIGSFRGRSMAVLATAAPNSATLIAVDPHGGGDRGPGEISDDSIRGDADNATFWRNLQDCGVADRVRLVRRRSDEAHPEIDGEIDLLYIDGAHRYEPALSDIRTWGKRVAPGGTMLIHDSFNSIGVTGAQVAELFTSSEFSYAGRSRSMTRYTRTNMSQTERRASTARQVAELPYFAWALTMKAMVSVGLGGVTRKLGNPEGGWPY